VLRKKQFRSFPLKARPASIILERSRWALESAFSSDESFEPSVLGTTCRQKKLHKSPESSSDER
jgi:hypothetical protein